ncbi:hypothetical protein EVG20_g3552 [Dentipellis fragilis]|uniref:Uncharacterized protein n=1 Tax=Dentipellis fragilis TaxID=205917 RepID=A0A4Y9Z3I7_9AGAM|nr:hypothetical protein EVG20_g3552 [Dentipellis fragilis]
MTFPAPLSAVEDQLTWWYRTISEDLNVDGDLVFKPEHFILCCRRLQPGGPACGYPDELEEACIVAGWLPGGNFGNLFSPAPGQVLVYSVRM